MNPAEEQVKEYEMTEREYYRRFDNLSKKEVNKKNSKEAYVRNDVMKTAIKHSRGEKKRGIRTIDGFRKKLMIPDSEIPKCPEFEVKLKIGKILKKYNPLEEYSVRIYEIDLYFYEHYEKKIQVDKNERKYILFRIDVYFDEFLLAVEIDEKGHTDRDPTFEKKKRSIRKKTWL